MFSTESGLPESMRAQSRCMTDSGTRPHAGGRQASLLSSVPPPVPLWEPTSLWSDVAMSGPGSAGDHQVTCGRWREGGGGCASVEARASFHAEVGSSRGGCLGGESAG